MSYVLSLDPGRTTGWARWNDDGVLITAGQGPIDDILALLVSYTWSAIVVEDYRLQKHRALQQAGSRFEAVQVIGAAKLRAYEVGAAFERQEVTALQIATLHSGIQRPKNHADGHHVDAILHGYLYFEKIGVQPHAKSY